MQLGIGVAPEPLDLEVDMDTCVVSSINWPTSNWMGWSSFLRYFVSRERVYWLIYTFDNLQDVAKTSLPNAWLAPRGASISGQPVASMEVRSYTDKTKEMVFTRGITSTLTYKQDQVSLPDPRDLAASLQERKTGSAFTASICHQDSPKVLTKFGEVPKGSPLSYHYPMSG